MSTTTGIPTKINGITYRSRVEARWAIMLEQLFPGRVEYEPFDADGYIPDFAILGPRPLLIEVKAHLSIGELSGYTDRLEKALKDCWDHDVMIVGGTPMFGPGEYGPTMPVAGIMGEAGYQGNSLCWEQGLWISCDVCAHVGFVHELNDFTSRPCGCYDGNPGHAAPIRLINYAWREASELSRWMAK